MLYTEAYKERQQQEKILKDKWSKVLNANGGIASEEMARTTAILCENFLRELKNDPKLLAEDRVQTGAFKGINLALVGLITRVIPQLIGAELVGVQAMPTPTSPIFTMTWHKDDTKGFTTGSNAVFPTPPNGDELWYTPINKNIEFGGVDPYYTSNQIFEKYLRANFTGSTKLFDFAGRLKKLTTKGYIFPDQVVVYFLKDDASAQDFATYGEDSNILARAYVDGSPTGDAYPMTVVKADSSVISTTGEISYDAAANAIDGSPAFETGTTGILALVEAATGATVKSVMVCYQYDAEAEGKIPEISFKIQEESIKLIRRQLRGKYTVDAAQDLKVLHGVNLDSELVNMMKNELMHEINHEIVTDLRKMAATVKSLDFHNFVTAGATAGAITAGNYDDATKLMLDAANRLAAEIWVKGRLGYANWILGNPATLSYLDRVPGFVGSGVTYNGRDLSLAGSQGGKMKIYHDPTYPENELLIGFKGTSALEAGYLYCPYLPITATPTLYDPETGDPSKIFYTRYSKTLKEAGTGLAMPKSVILNGQLQYARLKLVNYPGSQLFS